MKIIINGFDGPFAVCQKESSKLIHIKRNRLPRVAKEGDVLNIEAGEISIDIMETRRHKKLKI